MVKFFFFLLLNTIEMVNFPPIFVINLEESKDRLYNITKQMNKLNLDFERIDAVHGKKLSKKEINFNCSKFCKFFCPKSIIGIHMSHKKIWEKIVNENIEYAIVMEDDCELISSFTTDFLNVFNDMIDNDIEMVYLGYFGLEFQKKINETKYLFKPISPLGMHCYIISLNGAKKLLKELNIINYHVDIMTLTTNINYRCSKKKLGYQFSNTQQSSQIRGFPIIFNTFFDKILDKNGISWGFYFEGPLLEICNITITPYIIILLILIATKKFTKIIIILLLIELILNKKNYDIIIKIFIIIFIFNLM